MSDYIIETELKNGVWFYIIDGDESLEEFATEEEAFSAAERKIIDRLADIEEQRYEREYYRD
jgi:hypothetical protein